MPLVVRGAPFPCSATGSYQLGEGLFIAAGLLIPGGDETDLAGAAGDAISSDPGWGPGTPKVGQPPDEPSIAEVLKGKVASIKNAPLPQGSPSWNEITNMTLSQIRAGAKANLPGYKTILKLLSDSRFNK